MWEAISTAFWRKTDYSKMPSWWRSSVSSHTGFQRPVRDKGMNETQLAKEVGIGRAALVGFWNRRIRL
jgi:hypothetical protein